MAKVLATTYRYVEVTDEEKGLAKRHVFRPGESPKGLPKEVVDDLDERGLLVDERRFSKELGVVLPAAEAVKRMEAEEEAPKAESKSDSK